MSSNPPKNFCISPFISTRQGPSQKVSPCAFGAGEWFQPDLNSEERWNSKELESLRQRFLNNEQPKECTRCWNEEKAGAQSLRLRQYEYFPNAYEDYILTEKYKTGPITAVIKTSNICNLACRSCAGWDSSLYKKEGEYYAEKYKTWDDASLPLGKLHNRFIPLLEKREFDFKDFINVSQNLEKIDFYGGEPLLNETHVELLEHLVNTGKSKDITLYYSTNTVQFPKKQLLDIWNKFKAIELSLSIDGIGKAFEYTRWPGNWDKCERNIKKFVDFKHNSDSDVSVRSATCFSIMTLFNFKETHEYLNNITDSVYVNIVQNPAYLNPYNIPDEIKPIINEFYSGEHSDIVNFVNIKQSEPKRFKQFCIWMARQDEYRKQNLKDHLPMLYEVIEPYWKKYTKDLSENYFHFVKDFQFDNSTQKNE